MQLHYCQPADSIHIKPGYLIFVLHILYHARYALGYVETCEHVKKGEVLMQLGVGGGIKAGCNVWRALRDIEQVRG